MHKSAPLVLVILDGWGFNPNKEHNAIAQAQTPQWDKWWQHSPHILLEASGTSVGLPDRQMGNSEVGHMHIGSGRLIEQDFTRINQAIEQGHFNQNSAFLNLISQLKKTNKTLHIMGLLSPGGVHSHEKHLFAFLALCAEHDFHAVCLHLFLDGRDTPPKSATVSIEKLKRKLNQYPVAKICSITGRYYAMDRDNRWERILPVYNLLTANESAHHYPDVEVALDHFYQLNITDEFIPPTIIGQGQAVMDGDAIFFYNFRADRARQLTRSLVDPDFQFFARTNYPKLSSFVSMTQYEKNMATQPAFPPISMSNTLGEVLSQQGLKQLRIAETEKYAHVTFFFNGGIETPFPHEDRILIPSPKVATYDLQPEMSAPLLTEKLITTLRENKYDVIICNYANADMVGHTGNFPATIRAIECLDQCLEKLWAALESVGGQLLITADHGNAEEMFDELTGQAHTAHTSEPVPLLYIGGQRQFKQKTGKLIDIAPTILNLIGISPPPEMKGEALLVTHS